MIRQIGAQLAHGLLLGLITNSFGAPYCVCAQYTQSIIITISDHAITWLDTLYVSEQKTSCIFYAGCCLENYFDSGSSSLSSVDNEENETSHTSRYERQQRKFLMRWKLLFPLRWRRKWKAVLSWVPRCSWKTPVGKERLLQRIHA